MNSSLDYEEGLPYLPTDGSTSEPADDRSTLSDYIFEQQSEIIRLSKLAYNNTSKMYELLFALEKFTLHLSNTPDKIEENVQDLEKKVWVFKEFALLTTAIHDTDFQLKMGIFYTHIFKIKELFDLFLHKMPDVDLLVDIINNYVSLINFLDSTMISNKLCLVLEKFVFEYQSSLDSIKEEVEEFLAKRRIILHYDNYLLDSEEREVLEIQFNMAINEISKTGDIKCCFEFLEKQKLKCYEEQLFLFSKLFPYFLKKAFEVCYTVHPEKISDLFDDGFSVMNKMLFQSEYQISVQKNGMYETVCYHLVKEKQILQNFVEIYNSMALLINEALIRPSMTEIQEKALEVLKRFWYYFPTRRERLYKPVMILITNLCLFGSDKGKKDATVFLYHIIQRDRVQPMIDILNGNQDGKNKYQELLKP